MGTLGGTRVIAPVRPFDSADLYPSHEAIYGKGGIRTVTNLEDRSAISSDRREHGMVVFVISSCEYFGLCSDLSSWYTGVFGGGGTAGGTATVTNLSSVGDVSGDFSEGDLLQYVCGVFVPYTLSASSDLNAHITSTSMHFEYSSTISATTDLNTHITATGVHFEFSTVTAAFPASVSATVLSISSVGDIDITASLCSNQILVYNSESQVWQGSDISSVFPDTSASTSLNTHITNTAMHFEYTSCISATTDLNTHITSTSLHFEYSSCISATTDLNTHITSTSLHFEYSSCISATTDLNTHVTATSVHFAFSTVTAAFPAGASSTITNISSIGDIDITASLCSNQVLVYRSSSQVFQGADVSSIISTTSASTALNTHITSTSMHFEYSSVVSATTDLNTHTTASELHFAFSTVTAAFPAGGSATIDNISSIGDVCGAFSESDLMQYVCGVFVSYTLSASSDLNAHVTSTSMHFEYSSCISATTDLNTHTTNTALHFEFSTVTAAFIGGTSVVTNITSIGDVSGDFTEKQFMQYVCGVFLPYTLSASSDLNSHVTSTSLHFEYTSCISATTDLNTHITSTSLHFEYSSCISATTDLNSHITQTALHYPYSSTISATTDLNTHITSTALHFSYSSCISATTDLNTHITSTSLHFEYTSCISATTDLNTHITNTSLHFSFSSVTGAFLSSTIGSISSIGDIDITASPCSNQVLYYNSSSQVYQAGDVSSLIASYPAGGGAAITVVDKTADYTVPTSETNGSYLFTNNGASGRVKFTVPAVSAGFEITFLCVNELPLVIQGDADDRMWTEALDDMEAIEIDDKGASMRLIGANDTTWVGISQRAWLEHVLAKGVFAGGTGPIVTMDTVDIGNPALATDFGDLSESRRGIGGNASSLRGLFWGGFAANEVFTIDYIMFASEGNATDFGDMTFVHTQVGACSSETRAIKSGGYSSAATNIIDYVTISSVGNAADFGDNFQARNALAGCGSPTIGVFGGGSAPGNRDTIDQLVIASTGNATDFGNLAVSKTFIGACSSGTRCLFAGGFTSSAINVIEYGLIASAANTADFGDLTVARYYIAGCSSLIRGLFGGGNTSGTTIDYVTIASLGDAVDFNDLTIARQQVGACSSGHGGLT